MGTKQLTVSGPTLEFAIKQGLEQIGLEQDQIHIRILQKDSQSVFGHREAIISLIFDEDESLAAIAEKNRSEFRSKFRFRLFDGEALVQVPSSFYDTFYVGSAEEREEYLRGFLAEHRIKDPDEEPIKRIVTDYQCQYEFVCIKKLKCDQLNDSGGKMHLEISEDRLLAEAVIFHGEGNVTEEEIYEALKARRCYKGVIRSNIRTVLENKYTSFFEIARGRGASDDRPGDLDLFFQEDERKEFAEMMELLTIDTRNIKDINISDRNQLLLRVGEIITGQDGYTVDGEVLKKKDLLDGDAGIKLGKNVHASDDRKEVYAKQSGHIVWRSEERFIDIEPIYVVKGNVDFSEGNIIGFVGKVLIHGDVKPKFTVIAEGDIEIRGSVEDAVVKSNRGSVRIAGSVIHRREGYVQAKRTVHCSIATNAVIRADQVIAEKEVLNSELDAENEVIVTGSPGVILGGNVKARQFLKANTLGSENWVSTKIRVGDVSELKTRLRRLQQKMAQATGQLKEARQIAAILRARKERGSLTQTQGVQLSRTNEEIPKLEDQIQFDKEEEMGVKEEMKSRRGAQLEVLKTVHPQVDIYCFEAHFVPQTPEQHTGFRCKDGQIRRYPL